MIGKYGTDPLADVHKEIGELGLFVRTANADGDETIYRLPSRIADAWLEEANGKYEYDDERGVLTRRPEERDIDVADRSPVQQGQLREDFLNFSNRMINEGFGAARADDQAEAWHKELLKYVQIYHLSTLYPQAQNIDHHKQALAKEVDKAKAKLKANPNTCLLYTSPSPRDS